MVTVDVEQTFADFDALTRFGLSVLPSLLNLEVTLDRALLPATK